MPESDNAEQSSTDLADFLSKLLEVILKLFNNIVVGLFLLLLIIISILLFIFRAR